MSEPGEDKTSLFLWSLWNNNRSALLLFSAGLLLLSVGIFFLFGNHKEEIPVVISGIATDSGRMQGENITIKVDVEGAVKNPGVIDLPKNSRLEEAIVKAGGFSSQADRTWIAKNVNLAAKLIDGQKIYLPFRNEKNLPSETSFLPEKNFIININTASLSELETLSGVGPVTAQKIIWGRPYENIEDLMSKKIVGKSVFEKIKDQITVY